MALRTEGVGRGVNWQGLSNLANIIQRGGETQAEIFRGIGEGIVKRRQFSQQMAAEKEQSAQRQAFDMAALVANLAQRQSEQEQSKREFEIGRLDIQKREQEKERRLAAETQAEIELKRQRLDFDRALAYAEHGIQTGDQATISRSGDALKRIVAGMATANNKKMSVDRSPWQDVLEKSTEVRPSAFVAPPDAPQLEMPKTPSAAVAQRLKFADDLMNLSDLSADDANRIVIQAGSSAQEVANSITELESEVRRLKGLPQTPKNVNQLRLAEYDLAQARIDMGFAASQAGKLQQSAARIAKEREATQIAERNKILSLRKTPENAAFIDAFMADPDNNKVRIDTVLAMLDKEEERTIAEPQRRVSRAVESYLANVKRQVSDALESMVPYVGKDSNEAIRLRMNHLAQNLGNREIEVIATTPDAGFDAMTVKAARKYLESEQGVDADWDQQGGMGIKNYLLDLAERGGIDPRDIERVFGKQGEPEDISDEQFEAAKKAAGSRK